MGQPRCYYCPATEGLSYCESCEKYFCPTCKKKYAARIRDMILEATKDPRNFARKVGKVIRVS